ncbi:MAG TPA: hypothetical protein DCY88_08535 [Cyanobacteria bacterium UBA11372]|nr:hypothetical protein [Cyanobacteria bacterium UBA11372]
MSSIDTYLSNKVSNPELINCLLKYKLQLNFYGFLLYINFTHIEDIIHYTYYFNYFINKFYYIKSKLETNWIADSGRQAFTKTLENTQCFKEIQVINNNYTFLYDRFSCQPSQPSLIPALHLSPFCDHHIGFHGAAVARNQKSILIFGKNNSGKSTYSINLILNGYKLLSDDTIIYDACNNQVLAFPRPIGLREGTLKAHPKIKNLLHDKQLIRYKAVDSTQHLMIYPEELFPSCIVDYAEPYAAFFLNHVSSKQEVTLNEVDKSSLNKLLRHFSYYSELNPKEHSQNLQTLVEKLLKVYIISLDIKLTDIDYLIEIADRFLKI